MTENNAQLEAGLASDLNRELGCLMPKQWIRRNIVGFGEIIEERIKKENKTKNTLEQVIVRKITKAIILDCGHKIKVTRFNKVPTKNTECYECSFDACKT